MKALAFVVALFCSLTVVAQDCLPLGEAELVCNVNDLLPADVEVVGSTQGLAIYGNYAFSMHDKGQCVILDLKHRKFVSTFVVEGNTGHCNNASFGVERYSAQSSFPLLYVSECRGDRVCYVNDISLQDSRLVQRIYYDGDEITGPCDWAVDAKRGLIYLYCTVGNLRLLKWFRLPKLCDSDANGEVHLLQKDMLGCIPAGDIAIPQGSLVAGDYIYLPEGVPSRTNTALNVLHRESAIHLMHIDLTSMGIEPEGVAIRKGWLYLSFHTPREPRHNIIYRYRIN
ncbi:MAG: hypothetical protein IKV33_04210 [Alistipes sp.]|nr:hypothetical protein [Alistipes sp.]